jgi:acetoin utilization deacetylase AcuC-like enzyme
VSRTGFVYDERCELHDNGSMIPEGVAQGWLDVPHAENAERLRRTYRVFERSGVLDALVRVPAREATSEELELVHPASHVEKIRAASQRGSLEWVGPEARVSGGGSWTAAVLAAGGLLEAIDRVVAGELDNAFVCCRPPGHHASAEQAMGFCLFNSIAVAARYLQSRHGLRRIAIVDWDVHHGNGTQAAFYDDPSVLTISLHQDNCFPPGSGLIGETGSGAGEGYNINLPLPPGSGHGAYTSSFERVVLPALRAFRPELIVIASGFDASGMDPLGRQLLHSDSYRELTRVVMDVARECCDGRLVMSHEGGYSPSVVPFCGLAVLEQMSGLRTAVDDPYLPLIAGNAGQELQPHQAALIDEAAQLVDRIGSEALPG